MLPGDHRTVSEGPDGFGVRFDDAANNLGAVVARYVEEAGEFPGVLVLFTSFRDVGSGGPAYYVPIWNETLGTGLGPVDQRARFGTEATLGVANLKQPASHGERLVPLILHELGHLHLAYADLTVETASGAVSILGRQRAHWHAALHTEGSFLGGHGLRGQGEGRFVVIARDETYSQLDRYLLGLGPLPSVPEIFLVANARTESGAPIPADAQLPLGRVVLGAAVPLAPSEFVAALGPREPPVETSPKILHAAFALLTAPTETATDTPVVALAERLDALRPDVERAYEEATGRLGWLDTRAPERPETPRPDAGFFGDGLGDGCACGVSRSEGEPSRQDLFAWLLAAIALGRATGSRGGGGWCWAWALRLRRRWRERSCGRSRWCGSRPCRGARRLPRSAPR